MKNAQALRDTLSEVAQDLRNGKIAAKDASAIANITGKMISSAKAQLEHCVLRNESPDIEFLHEVKNDKRTAKPKKEPK